MNENNLIVAFQEYDKEDINFVNMVCQIRGIKSPFLLMADLYDEYRAILPNEESEDNRYRVHAGLPYGVVGDHLTGQLIYSPEKAIKGTLQRTDWLLINTIGVIRRKVYE